MTGPGLMHAPYGAAESLVFELHSRGAEEGYGGLAGRTNDRVK